MIKERYIHVWKYHNESPYFIQLICSKTKKRKKKNRTEHLKVVDIFQIPKEK
jgi:hypothetical protein